MKRIVALAITALTIGVAWPAAAIAENAAPPLWAAPPPSNGNRRALTLAGVVALILVIALFSIPAETREFFLTYNNFKIIFTQTVIENLRPSAS